MKNVQELPARVEQRLNKRAMPEYFGKGALVEVRSDEDGFEGSWYGATIIEKTGKNMFLVEYLSLRAESVEKYLREEVDAFHLRPHPLDNLALDAYHMNAKVDAFYNDGWWEGKVVKVLDGSRYRIYFHRTGDEMVFHHLDLRPHQDWVDGKWVHCSGKDRSRKTQRMA